MIRYKQCDDCPHNRCADCGQPYRKEKDMCDICKEPLCGGCTDAEVKKQNKKIRDFEDRFMAALKPSEAELHREINDLHAEIDALKKANDGLRKGFHEHTGYEDIDRFLAECFDTMKKKGHDYRQGNDSDVLHNFRTVGESVGLDMTKVWFTYFYKHYSALVTYIKEGGQSESEPIEGRVKDMIVYLLLFYHMINENKEKKVAVLGEIAKRADEEARKFARLKKLKEANVRAIEDHQDEHRHEPPF